MLKTVKYVSILPKLSARAVMTTSKRFEQANADVPADIGSSDDVKKKRIRFKSKNSSNFPRIYTRTGDGGNSSLFTGERRPKSDEIFEALGTIDELSSHIGLALAHADPDHPYVERLQRIQCILQDVGSAVATPSSSARRVHQEMTSLSTRHTTELEEWIDEYTEKLPPLENFILPGGSLASSSLHISRSVCRRAERRLQPLADKDEVDREALKYVNRLSDFLFTVARFAAMLDKTEEMIYNRPVKRVQNPYQAMTNDVWKKSKIDSDKN